MNTKQKVKKSGLGKFSATKLSERENQKINGGNAQNILEDNVMLMIDAIVIEDNFL